MRNKLGFGLYKIPNRSRNPFGIETESREQRFPVAVVDKMVANPQPAEPDGRQIFLFPGLDEHTEALPRPHHKEGREEQRADDVPAVEAFA